MYEAGHGPAVAGRGCAMARDYISGRRRGRGNTASPLSSLLLGAVTTECAHTTMNDWWMWILLGVAMAVIELLTPGGMFFIFFSVAAVVVGVLALAGVVE